MENILQQQTETLMMSQFKVDQQEGGSKDTFVLQCEESLESQTLNSYDKQNRKSSESTSISGLQRAKTYKSLTKITIRVLIAAALIFPAFFLLLKNPQLLPNLDISLTFQDLLDGGHFSVKSQTVRWSIFASSLWCTTISLWYLVAIAPTVYFI